jgi:RNA polymerase sigma-70 factor, ECF subfamily
VRLSVLSSPDRDALPEPRVARAFRLFHSKPDTLETPLKHDPETNLAADCRAAARADFRAVFDRFSKPVFVFIYGSLGDRDKAEELTQETFIRAYRRLESMREDSRLSSWIFGIARNVVREAVKAKYRGLREASMAEPASSSLPDTRPRPDERMMSEELNRNIQAALLMLPEDQRTVFVLKIVGTMPYEQISDITGASIGKLKTDLHRARLRMRRELSPYLAGQRSAKRDDL